MASPFENVVQQALSLSARNRLRLAGELLDSVGPGGGEEVERAWEQEIEQRIAQVDGGKAKGRAWKDIKRDFNSRYGR